MEIYAYRPEGFSASSDFRMINTYQYKEDKYPTTPLLSSLQKPFTQLNSPILSVTNQVVFKDT